MPIDLRTPCGKPIYELGVGPAWLHYFENQVPEAGPPLFPGARALVCPDSSCNCMNGPWCFMCQRAYYIRTITTDNPDRLSRPGHRKVSHIYHKCLRCQTTYDCCPKCRGALVDRSEQDIVYEAVAGIPLPMSREVPIVVCLTRHCGYRVRVEDYAPAY